MSKRILYILLALSLGLNLGIIGMTLVHQATKPALDKPPGQGGREGLNPARYPDPSTLVNNHIIGMTRHLDLDQEQQKAIRAVLERYAPQQIKFQTDAAEAGRHLADAFAAPVFDPEQIERLTAKASAKRTLLDSLSAVMLVAEAAVLSPEQRRKYAAVAPSIHSKPQHHPGGDGPRGQ